jgi:hypothetical protein
MIPGDLDAWADGIERATGIRTTRDPDAVIPPCIFIDAPDISAVTMPAISCTLPVYVIGEGTGKARLDQILTMLPDVMRVTETREASLAALSIGGQDSTAYKLNVPVRIVIT